MRDIVEPESVVRDGCRAVEAVPARLSGVLGLALAPFPKVQTMAEIDDTIRSLFDLCGSGDACISRALSTRIGSDGRT